MDKKRSTRLDNLKTLTPPTSAFDSATTLSSLSLEDSSRRLNDITSNPEQLGFFQSYLIGIDAQKYLLFIEALNELRHENDLYKIEHVVDRIWKTFFIKDVSYELNIRSKDKISLYMKCHRWGMMTKEEAMNLFKEAEIEVKSFLNEKVVEYESNYNTESCLHMHTSQKYQKKVVVIGGGFTGFTAASILDPMPRFHVTLIDTKDSFEYTPGMIKLLVRPDETSSLRVRHDAYTKNGKVIIGYAENISHDAKCVRVNDEEIPFDYLVIATGSTYKSKLKSFDTSSLYRLSELSKEHLELKKAKSVLIIGGGLVGCELASEIAIHTYPPPYDAKKKITLIDSHATLVPRSSLKRRQNAMKYFADLGVEVVLNEKIVDFDVSLSNAYLGMTGKVYSGYDKVFVATGTSPCSHILLSNNEDNIELESCIDHWGRLRVKPTLQLDHHKYTHIFAGGDVTDVAEEKTGYSATLAGVCIARNICRIEKGKAPIAQGSKGTMSAPSKPLHGIAARGGVGRQKLSHFKKTFAFLNPTWAALKYFDENEFLEIVLGESRVSATAIGKKPKVLGLPHTSKRSDHSLLACKNKHTHQHHISQRKTLMPYEGSNEAVLSISATNLYGSDILACPCRNDSEIDATTIMESQPPSPTSITKSSDYLNWANEKLKPRPTPSSSNNSSLNLKKNLLSTQSKTPSNPSLLVTTEMRYHHRKLKSL